MVFGPGVVEVLQPIPCSGVGGGAGVADGGDAVAGGQPGGAEIPELPRKILVDQQQVHGTDAIGCFAPCPYPCRDID